MYLSYCQHSGSEGIETTGKIPGNVKASFCSDAAYPLPAVASLQLAVSAPRSQHSARKSLDGSSREKACADGGLDSESSSAWHVASFVWRSSSGCLLRRQAYTWEAGTALACRPRLMTSSSAPQKVSGMSPYLAALSSREGTSAYVNLAILPKCAKAWAGSLLLSVSICPLQISMQTVKERGYVVLFNKACSSRRLAR